MRTRLVTIALAGLLVVCGGESNPTTEAAAADPVVAALPIALPQVSGAGTGPAPDHAFTVQATSRLLRFDNQAAVDTILRDVAPAAQMLVRESAAAHGGDARAGLRVDGEVVLADRSDERFEGLHDLVADAVARARKQGERLMRPPQLTTALALDRSLTMATVFAVLDAVAMLEERSFLALVEGPTGRRGVPFSWPDRCPSARSDERCHSAAVYVAADGVFIGLVRNFYPRCGGDAPPWEAHLVSAFGGGCPTMGRAADVTGLDAYLDALAPEVPRCRKVLLGAEPGVSWAELVPFIDSLARRSEVALSRAPTMHTRCEEAIPVAGLAAAIAAGKPAAPELADDDAVWGKLVPVPVSAAASKPPKIVLDRVAAKGGLTQRHIRRITQNHSGEIRYCYNKALDRSPGVSGTIGFRLTIAADGEVGDVEVDGRTFADADMQKCIEASFHRWNYLIGETPKTSTTATVRWKLAPG